MSAPHPPWATLATAALWLVVLAGPLLGGAALARSTGRPEPLPPPPPHLGGFAELAVAHHLSTSAGPASPDGPQVSALTPVVAALDPPRDDVGEVRPAAAPPRMLAAVAHHPAGPGRYGVEVLVLPRDGGLETWQVTIRLTGDRLAVEGLPALVPTVSATPGVRLAVGRMVSPEAEDPIAGTVAGFLDALLTGTGELERWTVATAAVAPLQPAPMVAAELSRLGLHRLDDTTVAVAADVRATRPDGRIEQLQYPLLLTGRAGRWEVVRILPGLPPTPS